MKSKNKKLLDRIKFFISMLIDKDLAFYASSLSFYTIFSIIPLLLIMLNIFTALPSFADYYKKIQEFIFSNLLPMNSEALMVYIDQFLKNSLKMSMVSFAMVIVSSVLFFQNFEYIANKIFRAKPRGLWESITTFWTLVTLAPMGLGLSFYITGYIATLMANNEYMSYINILPFVPYIITWALFFLIFQITPNAKVSPSASLISSFIVSVIFSYAKDGFIYYVFYNKSYETIYGSFSILMFLFLWIYISWIIFIYGLKLCYLINSVHKYRAAKDSKSRHNISVSNRKQR